MSKEQKEKSLTRLSYEVGVRDGREGVIREFREEVNKLIIKAKEHPNVYLLGDLYLLKEKEWEGFKHGKK